MKSGCHRLLNRKGFQVGLGSNFKVVGLKQLGNGRRKKGYYDLLPPMYSTISM